MPKPHANRTMVEHFLVKRPHPLLPTTKADVNHHSRCLSCWLSAQPMHGLLYTRNNFPTKLTTMPALALHLHLLPPPSHLNFLSQRPGLIASNFHARASRWVVNGGRVGRFAGDCRCRGRVKWVAASTADVGSVVPGFGEGAVMEPLKESADDVSAFSHVRLVWLRFWSLDCFVICPVVRPWC